MPNINLDICYGKSEGLIISPSDLSSIYLNGVPLCYPNGGSISDETIKQKILAAQQELEDYLSIKLNKQIIVESQDFILQEFKQWGYIKSTFPIFDPLKLNGFINNVKQVSYPKGWLSIKRTNDKTKFRNLYLIPNTNEPEGGNVENDGFAYSGISPHLGFFGTNYIPNYWRLQYCTGWDACDMPNDLIDFVGKYAALQILAISGDLLYGVGIGNQSISLDGISQQYSTTKGGGKGAFSGRVQQYTDELANKLKMLKGEYLGFTFKAM